MAIFALSLSDPEGKVLNLYGVLKKKSLSGKTFLGIERNVFLIDEEGKLMKIHRNVKSKGYAQACFLDLSK